jgi:hypothetical protein
MVNSRLQMTDMVMKALKQIADGHSISILSSIRQDVKVVKTAKMRKFLADHAPGTRAWAITIQHRLYSIWSPRRSMASPPRRKKPSIKDEEMSSPACRTCEECSLRYIFNPRRFDTCHISYQNLL